MPVTITHSTLADGTFSATGAAAWDATHTVSGLGTMAEQNSNNVNITGGSITGVTGVLTGLAVNSTPTSGGAAGQIMFDTGSVLQESSALTFASNTLQINGANILGGTNSFTLGGAAAAVPSAQTIRAQSVVAGTSNTAGANLTITGSQGTGTGAGGSIIFQTAPAGSSGTAQNALSNALTINSSQNIIVGGAGTTSTGGTGTAAIGLGGNTNVGFISTGGGLGVMYSGNTVAAFRVNEVRISSTLPFGFASGQDPTANGLDVFLTRRGAANLRFGAADAAAPVAQTLSVQSVVAGTSNTAGANLTITGSQGTGTGAGGSIIFQVAPAGSSGTAQNALNSSVYVVPKNISGIGQTAWLGINQSNPQASIHSKGAYATILLERGSTTQGWGFGIDDANPPAFYYNYQATVGGGTYDIIKATYSAAVPLIAFPSPSNIGFSSTGSASGGAIDVILTRRGAANLRFGAADAAAPVAQTLSVQSVVAGTSNTAGANLTITGSQGTGTGAGGSIIFQIAPAGSSGTAQNALSTALTLAPSSASGGIITHAAGALANDTSAYSLTATMSGGVSGNQNAVNLTITGGGNTALVQNAFNLSFNAGYVGSSTTNGISVVNANAGTSAVYSASVSTASYRIQGNSSYRATTNASTSGINSGGVFQALNSTTANYGVWSSATWAVNSSWNVGVAGFGLNTGTGTQQIGGYFALYDGGTSAPNLISAALVADNGSTSSPVFLARVNAVTAFQVGSTGLVSFGSATSSFPALKRSTTILQVRLADDSAYAPVEASTVRTATAYTVATLPAAGTAGTMARVTDGDAGLAWGATVINSGAGATPYMVWDNGANWTVIGK